MLHFIPMLGFRLSIQSPGLSVVFFFASLSQSLCVRRGLHLKKQALTHKTSDCRIFHLFHAFYFQFPILRLGYMLAQSNLDSVYFPVLFSGEVSNLKISLCRTKIFKIIIISCVQHAWWHIISVCSLNKCSSNRKKTTK